MATKAPFFRALLFAGASSLVACSFMVDTSGLYGGADTTDAPSSSDAGGGDVVLHDAGGSDGSTESDTGIPDGAGGEDVQAGRLCDGKSTAAACDDFDEASTIGGMWQQQVSNGSLAIQPNGLSAPNALLMTMNAGGGYALLEKVIPFERAVHCELDVNIETPPPNKEVDYFTLRTNGSAGHEIYIAHFDTGFVIAEFKDNAVDRNVGLGGVTVGKWMHVVFDTDGNTATVNVDGTISMLGNLGQYTGPNRSIAIGCGYAGGIAAPTHALYDNVLCTAGK